MNNISIDGKPIGKHTHPYIIAELSANHNGSLERALETITMAQEMGADAVKLQTYTADTMTIDCDAEEFQVHGGLWDGYTLYNLYKWAQTPFEWHKAMFEHARNLGITVFSTPFDETAVDLLEDLNTPAYKVASFETIDLPLIRYIAKTKKPMIISTGMANEEEIEEAITVAKESGCEQLVLLHCVSGYPVPAEQSNLKTIPDMEKRFNVPVGLSDHTTGTVVPVAAAALGACVIAKQVTLSRKDTGPDTALSVEPQELRQLCEDTKSAWRALGTPGYECKSVEKSSIKFRRSIYFTKNLQAGEIITKEHIRRIRPGFGLAPKYYQELLGKTAKYEIERGTATSWDLVE
ncbi:MAG: pseudaminic acid synthase [Endozoicomonadaceae bacterium]|nr:pseudaminic acid synthase [Endozoicomonadaceae bacterium]